MRKIYLVFTFILFVFYCEAQEPFIMTWEVSEGDLDITIPVNNNYTYNYTIDFGDGTIIYNASSSLTHTYTSAGIYNVEITGVFPAILMYDSEYENRVKFKSIEQWGNISWLTMYRAFMRCYNLVINAVDAPDLSLVTDMSYMFVDAESFNQSINHWDVSNVEDMAWIFSGAITFNQPLDNWDVSSVISMFRMFYGALAFNQPLNSWNVSSVINFSSMFSKDENTPYDQPGLIFNQPLDNWDVSNASSMNGMFAKTEYFNQSLDNWDVSNVTNMDYMFSGTESFNQSLNSWNVSNVYSMKYMFSGSRAFNRPLNNWNTSSLFLMEKMFQGAISFNGSIYNWDVSNVSDMSYLFSGAIQFNQPIDSWNVSNVTTMAGMFKGATSFNQTLNSWNVSSVTKMFTMFEDATSFNQPLNNWDVSSVESMNKLFKNATVFNQPLDNWDVSNVESMDELFRNATAFNSAINTWVFSSIDEDFTTSGVSDMFNGALSFNQPLDLWDISGLSSLANFFRGASSFNQPLDNWDVSNVLWMNSMFQDASSFNQDLSSWDVSNVSRFHNMFNNATSFNQPLNIWDFSQMDTSYFLFGLNNFLSNTSMSIENYDALLQHLITFDINNANLGADGLEYCDEVSVDYLTNQLDWNISGANLAYCNTVAGSVYLDIDNNGCDATDVEVSNLFVYFENTNSQSIYIKQITNANYSGSLLGINFTASVQGLPNFMTSNPVNAIVEFSGDSTDETLDFCITSSQVVEDLSVTLIPISEARPGFEATYQLIVENIGTESISNVMVGFSFDDAMQSFVSAMPMPNTMASENLQFNFATINPFQSETVDIVMQTFTPPTVNGDDELVFNTTVLPDTNDYTPNNNIYSLEQIVVNSYDPNDIIVLQGETIRADQTNNYLDYVIRFQNTGTASAINVKVASLLHGNLDISTLRILSASHAYEAEIDNNIINFKFNDINLPHEEIDTEGSNGYVSYRIKPKSDIEIGDTIDGIAGIYFDFNEPIITNMVTTEVVNNLSVNDYSLHSLVSIYPNPTSNGINIKVNDGVNLTSAKLYTIKGELLIDVKNTVDYINTEKLPLGVYLLSLETNKGKLNKKVIVN